MKRFAPCLVFLALACCLPSSAWALGEEHFGNAPLNELNYRDWEGIMPLVNHPSRVYHTWVNGNEHFYYRGDLAALNDALRAFAAREAKLHEVVLRPGPGVVKSFNGVKTIPFGWNLHIQGGISRSTTRLHLASLIWPNDPVLTIYVDRDFDLGKLEIPDKVSLVTTPELGRRHREAIAKSSDTTVRGWGAGLLARIDSYSTENMAAIAKLLDDKDNWVRLNAAGALAVFGKKAAPLVPKLRESLISNDKHLAEAAQRTVATIEQAAETAAEEREHQAIQEKIGRFVESRKGPRAKGV
jgi:hypothetical protein